MSEKDAAVANQIRRVLNNADQPLSTNQLVDRTGYDWHTVRDRLDELHDLNQVHRLELTARHTLWSDELIGL